MQNKFTLWTEKYRPKSPTNLDCSPFLKKFLENASQNGFPHLLLYGPPGTGKTTFASLLNPTFELNASDDRGIEMIRNKIKKVANTVSRQVIVLDECENLTRDSQTCLRRILEDFPNSRFIFCTNYYSKIIDPLKSRLLKLKFTLKESKALERIGELEGLGYGREFYKDLLKKCNFDLRKCLNILQGMKPLIGNASEVYGQVNCVYGQSGDAASGVYGRAGDEDTQVGDNTGDKDGQSGDKAGDHDGQVPGNSRLSTQKSNPTDASSIHEEGLKLIYDLIGIIDQSVITQFKSVTFSTYRNFIKKFLFEGFNFIQLLMQLSSQLDGTDIQKAEFSKVLAECEGKSFCGCSDEICLEFLTLSYLTIYS